MKKLSFLLYFTAVFFLLQNNLYSAVNVKIREIAFIDGLKENQVFGFGVVVGLQGTGDSKTSLAESSLKSVLKSIGITEDENYRSKNIAAVFLTAKLPSFVRIGDRVDVAVSSIGDAKSLEGGVLVQSPLMGADGRIYVVSQGSLSFSSPKSGKKISTAANVVNGGIVERALEPDIVANNAIILILRDWDFTVANNIIKAVEGRYIESKPEIVNNGRIKLLIPKDTGLTEFISTIENMEVNPGTEARVVINERDGTIVMGGDVKISDVVVSKDGMIIKVGSREGGAIGSTGETASTAAIKGSSVKDIVDSLNYIGASTRDIIAILKAIKDAGALHANLIIK
ncbi:MAG: flagellar basal body P-ring protein FlgI [Spirochaetes bacterium]|nr:flagellar basal body P-ring protein FlgI [Spirochaetota bacterium]